MQQVLGGASIAGLFVMALSLGWALQTWRNKRRSAQYRAGKLAYRFCPNCSERLEKRMIEDREKLACPSCSFVFWNNPIMVGVALIPFGPDGKDGIVLVKRKYNPRKGKWALPGGFGEPNEHPEGTSKRESGEEVCLDIEIAYLLMVDSPPDANQTIVFYIAKPVTTLPAPGSEAEEARVFKLDELPEEIAFSTHAKAIALWKTWLSKPELIPPWLKIA